VLFRQLHGVKSNAADLGALLLLHGHVKPKCSPLDELQYAFAVLLVHDSSFLGRFWAVFSVLTSYSELQ
jgi:hypothetical protein